MKKLGILAAIAAALVAALLLIPKQEDRLSSSAKKALDETFPVLTQDQVSKLEILYEDKQIELVHSKGQWWVGSDEKWPADTRGIAAVFDSLGHVEVDRVVSHAPEKHQLFEVTTTRGATVRFYGNDGETLLALIVGKLGPDLKSSYVRHENGVPVYVVEGSLRNLLSRKPDLWRDRTFSSIKPEDVHRIEMAKTGGEPVIIERDVAEAGAWKIVKPEGYALGPMTGQHCEEIARQLAAMVASELPPEAPDSEYGFDKPRGIVTIIEFNGKKHIYTFGKENEKRQVYAKRADSDIVYLLQVWMVDRLLPSVETLEAQKQ